MWSMGILGQVHHSQSQGQSLFSYISVIRHFGAVWAWPDLYGCTCDTLSVEVGVGTGVTCGVDAGVETWTAGFGSGVKGATDCHVC